MVVVLVLGLACNKLGFGVVSMSPTHGWTEGCTDVAIGGHAFARSLTATLGGVPLDALAMPDAGSMDDGFEFTAVTPPGEHGYQDLVVTSGADKGTLADAFYYVECPGPLLEAVDPAGTAISGGTLEVRGCGLDSSTVHLVLAPPEWDGTNTKVLTVYTLGLTSLCTTARAQASLDAVVAGTYLAYLQLDDGSFSPDPSCVEDTADTATTCPPPLVVTVGGGE